MLDQILLIKELLEIALKYKKTILTIFIATSFLFFILIVWSSSIDYEEKVELDKQWENLSVGDSVFIKENIYYIGFYKKGRQKMTQYDQRKIKYKREDTLNFIKKNNVPKKYFYRNNTSFVGICIGKDSSITNAGEYKGHRWLMVKPSYGITHPPISGKYDYDKRQWNDGSTSFNFQGTLSKNYFVNFTDIILINNDSIFK